MATNFRREIALLLLTRIPQRMDYEKADGRFNSAEVLSTWHKNLVNFGPLTPEFMVMVWRPFMRQMGEIGETRSILGTGTGQWMAGTAERICAKFKRKRCFGPSLGRVGMSRSKVKGQGHQGQKTHGALTTPRSMNEMERPRCR